MRILPELSDSGRAAARFENLIALLTSDVSAAAKHFSWISNKHYSVVENARMDELMSEPASEFAKIKFNGTSRGPKAEAEDRHKWRQW